MLSAHSTAVRAAIRRLSDAAHSQKPAGMLRIATRKYLNLLLSRRIHVARRLIPALQQVNVLAGKRCRQLFHLHRLAPTQ